jgi:hypothetical protein
MRSAKTPIKATPSMPEPTSNSNQLHRPPPIPETAVRAFLTIAVLLVAAWVAGSVSEWLIGLIVGVVFGGETLVSAIPSLYRR